MERVRTFTSTKALKITFWALSSKGSSLVQVFGNGGVDFDIAHLDVLLHDSKFVIHAWQSYLK